MTTPSFPVADPVAGPALSPPSTGEVRRFAAYTYWSLVGTTTVMLGLLALSTDVPHPPALAGTVVVGSVVVVGVAVAKLAAQHIPPQPELAPPSRGARTGWVVVGSVGAAALGVLWASAGEPWLWALAPGAVGSLLVAELAERHRRVGVLVALGAAASVGAALGSTVGDDTVPAVAAAYATGGVAVTAVMIGLTLATIWTWRVVVQLEDARRTAGALAVAQERLRFAADLHDIQGHSLQVIALKGELAARLARRDPETAVAQMTEVQRLATDALRDTRSVVEGYRRTSLDAEIVNASNVLRSAGIDTELHLDEAIRIEALDPTVRRVLGLVVREAVTNVLRHSEATRAELDLRVVRGKVQLQVRNDAARASAVGREGGLGQLADRLRAVDGSLTWRREDDRFEVQAEVPVAAAATAGGERGRGDPPPAR